MTARCFEDCNPSPSMACRSERGDGCGWYAYKTQKQAQAAFIRDADLNMSVAKVLLWGTVIEYTEGYRAQYLAVDEIYETPGPEPVWGSADFGPGSIVSTKGVAPSWASDPAMAQWFWQAAKMDITTAACGEQCEWGCPAACVRDTIGHAVHLCGKAVQTVERAGMDLP